MDLFGYEKIRTLGLYQPFATLMLHGKVETRWVIYGKKAPFPLGMYLIYSCQKAYDMDFIEGLTGKYTREIDELIESNLSGKNCWLTGEAGAIGRLVSIIDPLTPGFKTFVDDGQYEKSEYKRGARVYYRRVGLVFEDVKSIKPFEFKGKQGVGFLDDKYKSQIEFI